MVGLEKEIQTWRFLDAATLKGMYLPNVLIEASYVDSEDQVRTNFLERGWILNRDMLGNGATLTKAAYYE